MEKDRDFLRLKVSHLHFAESRGLDKTYCPSEVAREIFSAEWREQMDLVRKVADHLVTVGKLVVMQKGIIQSELPSQLIGPIRLRKKG